MCSNLYDCQIQHNFGDFFISSYLQQINYIPQENELPFFINLFYLNGCSWFYLRLLTMKSSLHIEVMCTK